jgi:hypothetical protein
MVKKNLLLLWVSMLGVLLAISQNAKLSYPIPEYNNEIYLVKKDSTITLVRLEKGSSKQEMKMKMMGMGGMDQGYALDDEKSTVRLNSGNNLVFVFYTGETTVSTSPQTDSLMRANGMNPNTMSEAMSMFNDPSKNTSLYNMTSEKRKRKILLQSMGLMGKSKKTATKYTLSIKKVKENYYEMIVDKSLPKGEYAFVMMSMGSTDQSYVLFTFGID